MGRTVIPAGDPKAIKKQSAALVVESSQKSYFGNRFTGKGQDAEMPIQHFTDLESDSGDTISYDLCMELRQEPIEGDDIQEGTEEELKFFSDEVYIDQCRAGVDGGGKMTRKRTIHDLRKIARSRSSSWWARFFDEIQFIYLSGARGVNNNYITPVGYTGRAGNLIVAPDSDHLLFGGDATSESDLDANDKMSLTLIDRSVAHLDMLGGDGSTAMMNPIMIEGERHFVCVMSPYQEFDMRTNATTGQWLDIQKAAATALGKKSPIFKGGLGMYNDVVLHKHKNVVTFDDYGAGSDVEAARALVLAKQAGAISFGSPGDGYRFQWYEETRDNGNIVIISTGCIWGFKKVIFNGRDFGVLALDTAAKKPTQG